MTPRRARGAARRRRSSSSAAWPPSPADARRARPAPPRGGGILGDGPSGFRIGLRRLRPEGAMKRDMRQFFAERAELLAVIHLTRRDDLALDRLASSDSGVDFLVTLVQGGVPTGRMFGVQVNAREGSVARPRDLHPAGDLS